MTHTTRTTVVDDHTTALLADLDAAQVDDDLATRPVAQAALARILATDPAAAPERRAPRRTHRRGRWAAAGVAVLAGAVFAAVNLDERSSSNAYASWTPTPATAARGDVDAAGAACRRQTEQSVARIDDPAVPAEARAGLPSAADLAAARVMLAETRGDWTLVVIAGRGIDVTCLSRAGSGRVDMAGGSLGMGAPEHLGPAAFMSGGPGVGSTADGSFSTLTGTVGRDVTGLTVTTADGRRVEATIRGDRFAAWWPGEPVTSVTAPGEQVTVTLRLRDGSVRANLPGNTLATPHAGEDRKSVV